MLPRNRRANAAEGDPGTLPDLLIRLPSDPRAGARGLLGADRTATEFVHACFTLLTKNPKAFLARLEEFGRHAGGVGHLNSSHPAAPESETSQRHSPPASTVPGRIRRMTTPVWVPITALIISGVALFFSGFAVWLTWLNRRDQRLSVRRPKFTCETSPLTNKPAHPELRLTFGGPGELLKLDGVAVTILSHADGTELARSLNRTDEQIAGTILGPYRFRDGADGASIDGRRLHYGPLSVGERITLQLALTQVPSWSGQSDWGICHQWPLRLQIESRRGLYRWCDIMDVRPDKRPTPIYVDLE